MSRFSSGPVRLAIPGLLLVLASCAARIQVPPIPPASEIPALEARRAATPEDDRLRLELALAYRSADRPEDAVELLEPVASSGPGAAAAVTLAGAYEDLERFFEAREVYDRLRADAEDSAVRREAERRLLALHRLELRSAALNALARESELANTPPEPQTVGVFPFLVASPESDLAPLARALAELLTVDLSQTDRLRVVERSQIQYLLDELALAQESRLDPSTAARSGRLVGAGRIVQGSLDRSGESLSLQAIPVRVAAAPDQEVGDPIRSEGALAALFDMEKELAFALYDAMGIQLTPAEAERVSRRRTESLQALLYFGYGLGAADDGRLTDALAWFGEALSEDGGFDLAQEWSDQVEAELEWSSEADPHGFYRIAAGFQAPAAAFGETLNWMEARTHFLEVERIIPNPEGRDALTEALGTEGLGREGTLVIVIRPP